MLTARISLTLHGGGTTYFGEILADGEPVKNHHNTYGLQARDDKDGKMRASVIQGLNALLSHGWKKNGNFYEISRPTCEELLNTLLLTKDIAVWGIHGTTEPIKAHMDCIHQLFHMTKVKLLEDHIESTAKIMNKLLEINQDIDSDIDQDIDQDIDSDIDQDIDSDIDQDIDSDIDQDIDQKRNRLEQERQRREQEERERKQQYEKLELERQKLEFEKQKLSVEKERNRLEQERQRREQEERERKQQYEKLELERQKLEFEKQKLSVEKERNRLEQERQRKEQKGGERKQQVDGGELQKQKEAKLIMQLQQQQDKFCYELSRIQAELKANAHEDKELQVKVKTLTENLERLISEQKQYVNQQKIHCQQLAQLNNKIDTAATDKAILTSLAAQIAALEGQLASLKTAATDNTVIAQLKKLHENHLANKRTLEALAKTSATLSTQLQGAIKESTHQAQKYQTWQAEFTAQINTQQTQHKAMLTELQTELHHTKAALNKRLAIVEKQVEGLEGWLSHLQKEISAFSLDMPALEERSKQLQTTLADVLETQRKQQSYQMGCQKQISTLRAQINNADADKARSLEEKLNTIERELATFTAQVSITELQKQLKGMQEALITLKKDSEQKARQTINLRNGLQAVISQVDQQSQQLEAWQKELVDRSAQQNKQQQEALSELQTQVSLAKLSVGKRLAMLENQNTKNKPTFSQIRHFFESASGPLPDPSAGLRVSVVVPERKTPTRSPAAAAPPEGSRNLATHTRLLSASSPRSGTFTPGHNTGVRRPPTGSSGS